MKSLRCCVQVVYGEFFMATMQMVVAGCSYSLVFSLVFLGRFSFPIFVILKILISLNGIPWSLES